MTVATTVRKARLAANLSVRELANQVPKKQGGVIGPSYITDIEKERGIPSPFVAEGLARALDLNVDSFLRLCERERGRR